MAALRTLWSVGAAAAIFVVGGVLVFLAGAACGFFGAVHMHQVFFARMAPDSMAQHLKERMRVELRLTPDQMQKISASTLHGVAL